MSNSTFRFHLLASGLLMTILSAGSAFAVEITPYSAEAQTFSELELDINDSSKATAETDSVGNYNFSPSAASLMNASSDDCRSQQPSVTTKYQYNGFTGEFECVSAVTPIDYPLVDDVHNSPQVTETPAVKSETDIATEEYNFPIPEPSSLMIWIVLGICGGFLIRRRAKQS